MSHFSPSLANPPATAARVSVPMRASASIPTTHSVRASRIPKERPAFFPAPGLVRMRTGNGNGPAAFMASSVPSSDASSITMTSAGHRLWAARSASSRGRVSASLRTGRTTVRAGSGPPSLDSDHRQARRRARLQRIRWRRWTARGRKRRDQPGITAASSPCAPCCARTAIARRGPRGRGGSG